MTSSLSASQLMTLIDAGLTAEQLRVVAEVMSVEKPRTAGAERQARLRERRRGVTRNVTDNVTERDPSPLGPPSFPHTPYLPPIIPPTGIDGDDVRDALGWPVDAKSWVDSLINETGCADAARDIWPRQTVAVVLGWHDIDRFAWRDVVAGIRLVTARAPDPPSTWRYFSKAIARVRRDRIPSTPEPIDERSHRARDFPARPECRQSRSTAYLVAAVDRARQRRGE